MQLQRSESQYWVTDDVEGVLANVDVDDTAVASARRKHRLDAQLRAMFREIIWQVIMLVLFTWVIVGPLDANVYHQNQDVRNSFIIDAEVQTFSQNMNIFVCYLETVSSCNV